MNAQASLSSSHIERVAEKLLSVDTADMRFLAVYFEEEFPLYELRYACAYSSAALGLLQKMTQSSA